VAEFFRFLFEQRGGGAWELSGMGDCETWGLGDLGTKRNV